MGDQGNLGSLPRGARELLTIPSNAFLMVSLVHLRFAFGLAVVPGRKPLLFFCRKRL